MLYYILYIYTQREREIGRYSVQNTGMFLHQTDFRLMESEGKARMLKALIKKWSFCSDGLWNPGLREHRKRYFWWFRILANQLILLMEDILHQIACLTVYIALPIPGSTGFLPSTVLQMCVYNVDIHIHSWYVQYILFFQILLQHLDDGAWGFSGHVLSPGGQDLNLTLVLTLHEIVSGFMHNTLSLQNTKQTNL